MLYSSDLKDIVSHFAPAIDFAAKEAYNIQLIALSICLLLALATIWWFALDSAWVLAFAAVLPLAVIALACKQRLRAIRTLQALT